MRSCTTLGIVMLASVLVFAQAQPAQARGGNEQHAVEPMRPAHAVDMDFFFDALAPYGEWMNSPRWGWVWYPAGIPADWQPYTMGHWVLTDWGWTWVSDWDWGWAPFHYGRWVDDDDYGWVWIPGADWGPAWVTWDEGDDWIGWAPLPPAAVWAPDEGLELSGLDMERLVPARDYVFVPTKHFADSHLDRYFAPRARSVIIAPLTHNVTRYERRDGRIVDRSISPERVERVLGHPIQRQTVADVGSLAQLERERRATSQGMPVYRPRIARERPFTVPRNIDITQVASPRRNGEPTLVARQEAEASALLAQHEREREQLMEAQREEEAHAAAGHTAEIQRQRRQEMATMRMLHERDEHQMVMRHRWESSHLEEARAARSRHRR